MGFSHKSHGKRSDKETQSPMLKIFKDIMQKEKRDPEMTNLLSERHVERKRKHYSGSRSKLGHRTVDTSSSDHLKSDLYQMDKCEKNSDFDKTHTRSNSQPFQGEKRESRWFWSEPCKNLSKGDDTCSCVSCALKKMISSDHACMVCLVVLFAISVFVAFMLVYNSIPCMATEHHARASDQIGAPKLDYDRLKRKVNHFGNRNFQDKPWSTALRGSQDTPFDNFRNQDLSAFDDSPSDLTKLFDGDKIIDIQNSDRLKDFYRKLMETDAAIRKMRKSSYSNMDSLEHVNNNLDTNNNFEFNSALDFDSNYDLTNKLGQKVFPNRLKRSAKYHYPMKLFHIKRRNTTKSKKEKGKIVTQSTVNMSANKKPNNVPRNKRDDKLKNAEGLIIEKNKVIIEYKPSRIVAKCSHAPKDLKSHETQLKHPFYKNTQRFDELLGQFLDKRLPDLDRRIFDQFEDILLENNQNRQPSDEDKVEAAAKGEAEESTEKNQTEKNLEREEKKEIIVAESSKEDREVTKAGTEKDTEQSNAFESEFFDDSEGVDQKKERRAEPAYDILLSVSTIISPVASRTSLNPVAGDGERAVNLRKLMQVDAKEEDDGEYEDLELLAGHKEERDDNSDSDRKKRNNEPYTIATEADLKPDPISIHNANWKGLMPLYPEELSQMMKTDKVEFPLHNKGPPVSDEAAAGLKDVEYIEDYLDNGFEKLVQLAQAYSDYGVLDEKKEERKAMDKIEHKKERGAIRTKLAIPNKLKHGLKQKAGKSNFFGRLKKGTAYNADTSEGIRIEMRPTSIQREDHKPSGIVNMFQDHVKITGISNSDNNKMQHNKFHMFTPPALIENTETSVMNPYTEIDKIKTEKSFDPLENTLIYPINKKRTLKSVNFRNELDEVIDVSTEDGTENKYGGSMMKFKRDVNNTIENILKEANEIHVTKPDSNNNVGVLMVNKKETKLNNEHSNLSKVNDHLRDTNKSLDQNKNMTLSDFFMLLSNWFSSLDGVHVTSNKSNLAAGIGSDASNAFPKYDNGSTALVTISQYDKNINDNMGYKSRGLLSIPDNNTDKDTSRTDDGVDENNDVPATTESMKNLNITAVSGSAQSVSGEDLKNNTENHIAKRQAIDDSNLIFWNDLYDDEYGTNEDPLENTIRNKHCADKGNCFLQKSNNWIQDKIKLITNRLNNKLSKNGRSLREAKINSLKNLKRNTRSANNDDSGVNKKVDFAALTAKMKEVCRRTAKAIQQTKHIQVREEKEESNLSTSLMQQLVRLMTDLVDFQVQERTCRRLPPDLQKFLEWLTTSKKEGSYDFGTESRDEKPIDQDIQQQNDREDPDSKTDCLGTLHAVQDLIHQYEDMSDDDKSLMTGVKAYLENQRSYLERQLSASDDYKFLKPDEGRYKRDLITDVANKFDVTAHAVVDQYQTLKYHYQRYMDKLKQGSKKLNKATAGVEHRQVEFAKTDDDRHKRDLMTDVSNKCDVTAHVIVDQYQNIKHHYREYMDKLKQGSKKLSKVTAGLAHRTAEASNKLKKVTEKIKGKCKDKHKLKDRQQLRSRQLNNKRGDRTANTEKKHNQLKDYPHLRKDRDERNIKDVYFKAVEDAKTTPMKSEEKRVNGVYDNTDIIRMT